MDLSHAQYSELDNKFPKYKGRVVFRGDAVKDDSGSYAVFLSKDLPPAAEVLDVIPRLRDVVLPSAHTASVRLCSFWKIT